MSVFENLLTELFLYDFFAKMFFGNNTHFAKGNNTHLLKLNFCGNV